MRDCKQPQVKRGHNFFYRRKQRVNRVIGIVDVNHKPIKIEGLGQKIDTVGRFCICVMSS